MRSTAVLFSINWNCKYKLWGVSTGPMDRGICLIADPWWKIPVNKPTHAHQRCFTSLYTADVFTTNQLVTIAIPLKQTTELCRVELRFFATFQFDTTWYTFCFRAVSNLSQFESCRIERSSGLPNSTRPHWVSNWKIRMFPVVSCRVESAMFAFVWFFFDFSTADDILVFRVS